MEEAYRVAINRMGRALQSNLLGNRDGGSKLTPARVLLSSQIRSEAAKQTQGHSDPEGVMARQVLTSRAPIPRSDFSPPGRHMQHNGGTEVRKVPNQPGQNNALEMEG